MTEQRIPGGGARDDLDAVDRSSATTGQGARRKTKTRKPTARKPPVHSGAMTPPTGPGAGTWVVLPTYDEAENLPGIAAAILKHLPAATLLVVDDGSPDGTGELADRMATDDPRIRVRHRPAKAGLGRAYLDGFRCALRDILSY